MGNAIAGNTTFCLLDALLLLRLSLSTIPRRGFFARFFAEKDSSDDPPKLTYRSHG